MSEIWVGHTFHERTTPIAHRFAYPVFYLVLDLDRLEETSRMIKFWGYNRWRPLSLWDRDYLARNSESIRDKLKCVLQPRGIAERLGRVRLVTGCRYFGYVFNPVSFYLCDDLDGRPLCYVAEVNNTFSERHLYVLNDHRAVLPKTFHVSPFYDRTGGYDFHFLSDAQRFEICINIVQDGREDFRAKISGKVLPLTTRTLLKTLLRFPLTAWLTMPRILWQAAILRYAKGLQVFSKPPPNSEQTIRVKPPGLWEGICRRLIFSFFRKLQAGHLQVILPEGEVVSFGDPQSSTHAQLRIRDYAVFPKWVWGADLAFGETYTEGYWDSDDLVALLRVFAQNRAHADDGNFLWAFLRRGCNRLWHRLRANTRAGSRKNIAAHYDLGNDFFRTFLDPTLTYSCAVFEKPEDSLEHAQLRKIEKIIDRLQLTASDHLLEIGSGWGSLAIEAACRSGCRVTTITVSREQFQLVEERVRELRLQDQIEVRFCDYRDVCGQFDKIVSVEMLEAVGEKNLPLYFRRCEENLKPGGRAVIQVITISDQRYDAYRNRTDWVRKYVFPGTLIPSLSLLTRVISKVTGLSLLQAENIGPHYVRTLALWREQFRASEKRLKLLGVSEKFQRLWNFYLAYSEAGFAEKTLDVWQLSIEKPGVSQAAGLASSRVDRQHPEVSHGH